jgi:hypothetical protein
MDEIFPFLPCMAKQASRERVGSGGQQALLEHPIPKVVQNSREAVKALKPVLKTKFTQEFSQRGSLLGDA